ncbi:hypothetical protein [Kitasatospora azatica]|uniref:hypothetical protein n=1 Tax=Kitasatospora azatica TaxID=58347 RepID=UPI000691ED6E|nr:hypothetical protein [Kitasatospora azatica]
MSVNTPRTITRRTALAAAFTLSTLLGAGAVAAPAEASPVVAGQWQGAVLHGHGESLHPESAAWDPIRRQFVVGSLRHGTVSVVRADGGVRTLVADPRLVSVVGVKVDAARGRVLVCNADPAGLSVRSTADSKGRVAGLGSYDLETGQRRWYVDLAAVAGDGGPHVANDVAFDADGTAYVTDSFAPIVYRVTADGRASVLVRDPRIGAGPGQFGLNGIVLRGGRLWLGNYQTGAIWQLPLRHPERVELLVQDPRLVGLDGMAAGPDGTLVGVTNRIGTDATGTVVVVHPGEGGRVESRPAADPAPTAVTRGPGGALYVLSGRMDLLFAGQLSDEFTLRRI